MYECDDECPNCRGTEWELINCQHTRLTDTAAEVFATYECLGELVDGDISEKCGHVKNVEFTAFDEFDDEDESA